MGIGACTEKHFFPRPKERIRRASSFFTVVNSSSSRERLTRKSRKFVSHQGCNSNGQAFRCDRPRLRYDTKRDEIFIDARSCERKLELFLSIHSDVTSGYRKKKIPLRAFCNVLCAHFIANDRVDQSCRCSARSAIVHRMSITIGIAVTIGTYSLSELWFFARVIQP